MPDNIFLLTPTLIRSDELIPLLVKFGGFVNPDQPGHGWIPRGDSRVWIFFGPECGPDILADAILEDEEAVAAKLGTPPQDCIMLELSSKRGSQILAIDFAVAFMNLWPAILSDVGRHLYNLAEVRRLQHEGKGFGFDSAPAG